MTMYRYEKKILFFNCHKQIILILKITVYYETIDAEPTNKIEGEYFTI